MEVRAAALIVTALLLAAAMPALGAPSPSPGPFLGHAPIVIDGDANFTAAQGVVGGTGSPADPFVIAGWSIRASGGTAIRIHNVTKAFLVRDNDVSGRIGISVDEAAGAGAIQNNKVLTLGVGISVADADTAVLDNSLSGDISQGTSNQGIVLARSNALVQGNAILYAPFAIMAVEGSPRIVCNDIHDDSVRNAIKVQFTTNATIACNTITACAEGIASVNAIGTVIVDNSVEACYTGIDVTLTKDAVVANNTLRANSGVQLNVWHSSGSITGNVIVDGHVDAMVVEHSPMLVANNTISANLMAGIRLRDTSTDVFANVVSHNSVGIVLEGGSVPHLHANVLTNNSVGLDVPYASRQAILSMQANLVNGVNVDGTLAPSQKVYFYQAANVSIVGGVRDSGFSAGYFGSLTAQGNVVLYEVDTANVNATLISHARIGVLAINSFNVVVSGTAILQTQVGVLAQAVVAPYEVPPCVVSVKDTNITIPVDPAGTIGIDAQSCRVQVFRTSISTVDTGIRIDGQSPLLVVNATITRTKVGLDLSGVPNDLNVTGSVVTHNGVGAIVAGSVGVFVDNTFDANAGSGIVLRLGAQMRMLGNRVTANGAAGVIDAQACGGARSCSGVDGEGNTFAANRGDGARINGTTSWRGDVFVGNRGDGARLATDTTLRGVTASGNDADGIEARGTFTVRESSFDHNGRHGAYLVGSGDLRNATFSWNTEAGIRASPTYISALDVNITHNFDGILFDGSTSIGPPSVALPVLSVPGVWAYLGGSGGAGLGPAPMDVHHSRIVANERDGIRAGNAVVNATLVYWGNPSGPALSIGDQVGSFRNGVSPNVRFLPYYEDDDMTTTGPVPFL